MRARLVAVCITFLLLVAAVHDAAADSNRDRTLRVMTRNMDLGSDFGYILAAATDPTPDPTGLRLLMAITQTYIEVVQSDMPARAQALADEIGDEQPDLIGLQEVSTLRTVPSGGSGTNLDQLALLLDALGAKGLHYGVVALQQNLDATLPSLNLSFSCCIQLTLTDYDVVLARTDLRVSELKIDKVATGHFSTYATFNLSGVHLPNPRGWIAIDAKLRGKPYRFVTTHLETAVPQVQAAQATELLNGPLVASTPVILAGDLNSDAHELNANEPAYPILVTAGWLDAWSVLRPNEAGLTWPLFPEDPRFPPLTEPLARIDLVLYKGPRITPTEIELTGVTSPFASDHAGVAAQFLLSP